VRPLKVTILIPVYDDWRSLRRLIGEIHVAMNNGGWSYEIVIVDDGSPNEMPADSEIQNKPQGCLSLTLLRLRKNLGHQRAIAVGLVDIYSQSDSDILVVMDGDGEDSPGDIGRLIEACVAGGLSKAVFAQRTLRFNSALFKLGYEVYCFLHWLAVGEIPRVGNFSALPRKLLSALVVDPKLWNHFAAAVMASRLPRTTVPISRGERYEGESKLRFNDLVVHGLSALACYSEKIGVRVMTITTALLIMSFGGVLAVGAIHFFTLLVIPVWATLLTVVLLTFGIHLLMLGFVFCLVILSQRQHVSFLPIRDVQIYILERRDLAKTGD
jgi:glycosyltransferase involved in cell wall biosynthesis